MEISGPHQERSPALVPLRGRLKKPLLATAAVLLVSCAPLTSPRLHGQQPPEEAARLQRIDKEFAAWSGTDTPGCVAAAERQGELLLLRSYGMANLEHAVPVTPESVFEAGSVAKQFTAAAVLLLVDQGKLRLTDDVRTHVPELPDYGASITIDHLLTHSSGLSDWGTIMFHAGWPVGDRVYTNASALKVITRHPTLIFEPGTFFSYSNSGYILLAEIVSRVTGKSLAEFTQEKIFEPLGMGSTRWRSDYRAVVPHRATGYRKVAGQFVQDMPFTHTHADGGLLTTVEDLLTWNRALAEEMLGAFVTSTMQTPGKQNDGRELPYGRGVWVGSYRGATEISHGGGTAGYRAWLGRYPESGLSIALLCNGHANDVGLGRTIAAEFLPSPEESGEEAPPVTADDDEMAADLSAFAGHFAREKLGTPFTVATSAEGLTISGEPAVALGGNRFRISWGEFLFESADLLHELDTNGTIFQTFHRIDGPIPGADRLQEVSGRYYSAAALATYEVRFVSGHLEIEVEGRPRYFFRYTPIGPDTFRSTGTVVRAHRDADGRVEALTLTSVRMRDLRLVRIDSPSDGR
jgi:CubicO group peptidase (beta-lactamase class C family)